MALRSGLALFWLVMGVLHFACHAMVLRQMPPYWPWQSFFVYATGVAELAAAIALVPRATCRWGALGTMVLLVAYTPAVVQIIGDSAQPLSFRILIVPANVGLFFWARTYYR